VNVQRNAVAIGLRRGVLEFRHSMRSRQDWSYYLFTSAATVAYLYLRRDSKVGDTDLTVPVFAMPSILAFLVTFGVVFGIGSALVAAREDGTLLRARATPHGIQAYTTSQLVLASLSLVPQLLVILVPSAVLFGDALPSGLADWLTVAVVFVLALVALLPLGVVVGCALPSTQKMFSWGMLGLIGLAAISGIFTPVQSLWGWLQAVAQAFPLYWLGLGFRSAFLPDGAAANELTGGWRTGETLAVLTAWGIVGYLLAPRLLRRVARRQSGSTVEAARQTATQWVQ
jgi:ABC-2 type transport system permease protein